MVFTLGEFIQRLNFPVELRIKAEFIDTGKIKGMGRSNTHRYRNIMEEAENTGYCPTRRDHHGLSP